MKMLEMLIAVVPRRVDIPRANYYSNGYGFPDRRCEDQGLKVEQTPEVEIPESRDIEHRNMSTANKIRLAQTRPSSGG
jgi:hypothetical protein